MTGSRVSEIGERRLPHIIVDGFAITERYQSPGRPSPRSIPTRDRAEHGSALLHQVASLRQLEPDIESGTAEDSDYEGVQVEFVGFPDVELAFEKLARERSGIELLNVRREGDVTYATVFVPTGKLVHFENLITAYLSERRGSRNQALDNRRLIDTIREIRRASLLALWTDDLAVFPSADEEMLWWEVWLPIRNDRVGTVNAFRALASGQDIQVAFGEVNFPERTVVLAFASPAQMKQSAMLLNLVAEIRRAKETAEFFDSLPPDEQHEWVRDLLGRIKFASTGDEVPHVCLLDTGVNKGHALLAPALDESDLHTVEPAWGTNDVVGHGTEMAGLALFGDLTRALDSQNEIRIGHRLESVKLLRHDGDNAGDAQHHGYLTLEAVARPEITAPERARVFALAVTSRDDRDRGRPSAWSAVIDSLAADVDGEGMNPRLLLVSAGNVQDLHAWSNYPSSNSTDGIHDPGQAWNALTVGAYTDLINITEPEAVGYQPVASAGGLSPFSTTSSTWQQQWPLKPDIVLEGGNAGKDALGAVSMASLSLLTTHHQPALRSFSTSRATSASTALAAEMAAELMVAYPRLRPESIRALMVHSADWTDEMRRMYLPPTGSPTKSDYTRLVRHCGFGVPNMGRAKWSASNSLAMIIEEELHPFVRNGNAAPTLRDMQLHNLPWPLGELEALGSTTVEMRVTLSYYVEPNPSARGHSRYRYESHGLRFEVKRPTESPSDFQSRINRAARAEEEGTRVSGEDPQWLIGKQARHRGSLHCDIWSGSATDLASRGVLAVYPALGWWKTRVGLERYDKAAAYTLIVSIHAPEVAIDLYTPIATQIASRVAIEN